MTRYRPFATRSRLRAALALSAFLLIALPGCGKAPHVDETSEGALRYGAPSPGAVDWGEQAAGIEIGKAAAAAPKPRQPKTPTAKPPKSTPKKPIRGSGTYRVVAVANGGTIRGTVKFGSKPELWDVTYNKDQEKCGHTSFKTERVIFDPTTLGVANCVVYLADISSGKAWTGAFVKDDDTRVALLDQKSCRYHPHVQVVRPMTQLQIRNSDTAEHNVHSYYRDFGSTQFNQMTGASSWWPEVGEAYLQKTGPYIIKCDVHAWMSGYIQVVAHPYWAVTKVDGAFELPDVPPGKYVLVCWHEGMKEVPQFGGGGISGYDYGDPVETTQDVVVEAGKVAEIEFVLDAPVKSGG